MIAPRMRAIANVSNLISRSGSKRSIAPMRPRSPYDEILLVDVRGQARTDAPGDELHERRIGEDQPIAQLLGPLGAVLLPERMCPVYRSHRERIRRGPERSSDHVRASARRARSPSQSASAPAATAITHAPPPSSAEKTAIRARPAASAAKRSPSERRCTPERVDRSAVPFAAQLRGVAQLVERRSPKP